MVRLLAILAVVVVIFWVFSIVDAAVQPSTRHRGVGKPTWVVITIVLPVIGGVLWFLVGRTSADRMNAIAPDDDPDFLHRLGGSAPRRSEPDRRAREEQDERIRQLEQELARLDDDDDHPSAGRGR